jgi:hypothetical protein
MFCARFDSSTKETSLNLCEFHGCGAFLVMSHGVDSPADGIAPHEPGIGPAMPLKADSRNRGQQIGCRSVVPESLADVHVQVDIAGAENEASPELKRILAQLVLPVSGCTGSVPCQ